MPEYKVSIIVQGEDRASGPLGNVSSALGNMGQIAGGILTAGFIRNIINDVIDLGKEALTSYADFERLGLSLQSLIAREMVQSGQAKDIASAFDDAKGRAAELQGWIQKLAIQSPFKQSEVSAAFRQAMAYGFTSEQAQRLTQATIDFASGSGASADAMDRITLALGQIKAKGKLAGQEVLQLVNAGLPVTDILAKGFGVTTAQLVQMQEKGLIPADKAIEIITQSLEHDFGGAAKRQATTFSGLISSLSDIKEVGLREFFSGLFEAAKPFVTNIVDVLSSPEFMANLKGMGQELAGLLMNFVQFGGQAVQVLAGLGEIVMTVFGLMQPGFDNLSAFWTTQGPVILQAVQMFGSTLQTIFTNLSMTVVPWLVSEFNLITAWVNENGPLISTFASTFMSAIGNLIAAVVSMWPIVQPILAGLINIILDIAKLVMQVFVSDWSGAWTTIQQIVIDAWTAIQGMFLAFVNWVLQVFVGSDLKTFVKQWTDNFNLLKAIAQGVLTIITGAFQDLQKTISAVVGSVVSLIEHIAQITFPGVPAAYQRHSPSPIEQTFGNWAAYAKDVKSTMNAISFPNVGSFPVQPASAKQETNFNLYLSTTQSPAVVQQSFELMQVLNAI